MMQYEYRTFLDVLQRMASRRRRAGGFIDATTADTESAAANPKAGAAPTHPTSTPPKAGPLAKATVRASSIRALAAGNNVGGTSDGTSAGAATL
jgi:hypothetical protein